MKTVYRLLLSPRGRIGRGTFLGFMLLSGACFLVLFVFLETMIGRSVTWVLYPPLLWGGFCLSSKRLHDRATSAW